MNPIKSIVCLFKGHKINPKESIIRDCMINPYNLLCPCHRCGMYVAYDHSSGITLTYTKRGAEKLKSDFVRCMTDEFHESPEKVAEIRERLYGPDL